MHEIASHCHGEGAKQSLAKRKLDALGFMRGESGIQNDPERIKRLRNQLALADSIAEISKQEQQTKAEGTQELAGDFSAHRECTCGNSQAHRERW